MTSPLDTCLTGIDAALTTLLAARRRHRADARVIFAANTRQLVQAYAAGEVKAARDAHGRTLSTVDRLTAELAEATRTAEHRLQVIDDLRGQLDQAKHTITELQGQLAIAGDTIREQVPVGLPSAPEPNRAPTAPAAKPRNAPASRPGAPYTAKAPRSRTPGGSGRPKAAESRTAAPQSTDSRTIGIIGDTPKGTA